MRSRAYNVGMPSGEPLLSVQNLCVDVDVDGRFRPVLHDVCCTVEEGQIAGLFGDSGCGKTTLALAIAGLLSPQYRVRGSVRFQGGGRRLAFIFQDPLLALNPVLRVGDQVAEVIRAHSGGDRVPDLLRLAGLPPTPRLLRAYPHQLSGGERQRVLLAQAIAARPALVIADEPFTALDPIRVVELSDLFLSLKRELGLSMLVISHSAGVLARMADRVFAMQAGQIVESGSAREVLRHG